MQLEIDSERVKNIYQCKKPSVRNNLVKKFLKDYPLIESVILEDLKGKPFVDFKSILLKVKVLIEHSDSTQIYLFLNLILEGLRLEKKVTVLELESCNGLNVIIIPYKGIISIIRPLDERKIIYEK